MEIDCFLYLGRLFPSGRQNVDNAMAYVNRRHGRKARQAVQERAQSGRANTARVRAPWRGRNHPEGRAATYYRAGTPQIAAGRSRRATDAR